MQRATIQRKIILDTLKTFVTHPSAETLYAEICKNHPAISKATVYRNLRQLAESGEIAQIAAVDGSARYDGRTETHYHCNCKKCGSIFDAEIVTPIDDVNNLVQKKYGFRVSRHDMIFIGLCKTCCGSKTGTAV